MKLRVENGTADTSLLDSFTLVHTFSKKTPQRAPYFPKSFDLFPEKFRLENRPDVDRKRGLRIAFVKGGKK